MEFPTSSFCVALLVAIVCCVSSEETAQDLSVADNHQQQKRSALVNPADDERSGLILGGFETPDYDFLNKRGSLFRFGKRGSLFRFGKRGSLLRFGRSGHLAEVGGPYQDDSMVDKRTLFRFGKRSDLDLLREAIARSNYGSSLYDVENKRGLSSFHWGRETDEE